MGARRWAALLAAAAALPAWAGAAGDGGRRDEGRSPAPAGAELSAEDREVVENLELLESLEEAGDLELLLDLGGEEE